MSALWYKYQVLARLDDEQSTTRIWFTFFAHNTEHAIYKAKRNLHELPKEIKTAKVYLCVFGLPLVRVATLNREDWQKEII